VRIAVIGLGNIGATIGRKWVAAGHEVSFGSRHPDTDEPIEGARITTVGLALRGAEATLLALPAQAVHDFLTSYAELLDGQLVIDATNNLRASRANAAEQIKSVVPTARYVRAFNASGWENFADPLFDGEPADLFFSSSEDDRPAVTQLIADVGLRPAYVGADRAEVVDGALLLWFALMQTRGNRRIAFRVLEK
jgi:predicted dinucleotide-binding enzyme